MAYNPLFRPAPGVAQARQADTNTAATDSRRQGVLRLNNQLLVEALKLPKDTEILDVRNNVYLGVVEILVRQNALKPVPEAAPIPEVQAKYRASEISIKMDNLSFVRRDPIFEGWAQS